ncbi:F0F1 ATP synthase subunit epsilon [Wenyingzhuangia sp. 2_MG-2023]|uniref:FoF1 ATP synthase subunit delta/epsilon n=1 Tax=Wenyingzhuangia sp. 2_MG-2023 TaxID=3062639 RepID=UPI0026E474DC|nr:F0F1 ATP synthase subunit epsilon [Wenyingzhuangia sp. 2_MG-2023]MDO6736879.1 F0F1 ATP synthase subunit epsilon [Wenyingzhuangia sp. 2_MG-2023]MDO6800835.1 F0F1 ATP synthase subunit epsilon [Wenyingzhuangia sp. 1_MG-2023]
MYLEIVSPEDILFSCEVDSVTLPGVQGEFQMLNNHASIVSDLGPGLVKIHVHTQEHLEFNDFKGRFEFHIDDDKILTLQIKSGTVEMKDNKVILLAD